MSKRQISKKILICFLVFCSFFSFASENQHLQEQYTRQGDSLYSYQLENGFQIYVLEDYENPIIQISYISKAGYSCQNIENSGFPELANSLFFKNQNLDESVLKSIGNLSSEFKSDVSIFKGNCALGNLEKVLALFAEAAINPNYSDEILKEEFFALQGRVAENINNELAYINSSIDSVIFNSPWKQDTVLYPGILENLTVPEIRNNVNNIYSQFYTPEKSCIFITGAVKVENVYLLVKKYFDSWQKSIFAPITENIILKNPENKKYILVSDNFSTDFNQIIIQYPENGLFSDIKTCGKLQLAALSLENSYDFKTQVSNEISGIIDESYIYSGYTENGTASRVIIQGLMENNSNSPSQQVNNILEKINNGKVITNNVFLTEKNKLLSQEISSRLDTKILYDGLVSTWGYGGTEYFYSYLEHVKNLKLEDVQSVFNVEPFIFLLINSKTYSTFKNELIEDGYILLENTSIEYVKEESKELEESEEIDIKSSFYQDNIKTFNSYKLQNSIPVIEKTSNRQESFTLHLVINGGELFHGDNPGLETITIKYFADNIKNILNKSPLSAAYSIDVETKIYNSSITITCSKNDIEILFSAIKEALLNTDLIAAKADELIFTENYNYRLESSSTSFQLYSSAMETIFSGTNLEPLFNTKDNLLSSIVFTEIYKSYIELLDANRYTLICLGNIPKNLQNILNNTFSSLKNLNLVKNERIIPIVSNLTRTVQIKRIFSTDIKAEDAGPRPIKLIPTTVFTDPVDFYFETPQKYSNEYLNFLSLLTEFEKILNQNWDKNVKISIHDFNTDTDIVKVQFLNVESKYQSTIKNLFLESLEEFINHIEINIDENIENYKNQFVMEYYNFDNTPLETAKLIEKGFVEYKDYLNYLKNYDFIINSTKEDFIKALDYFEDMSVLEVRPSN